LDSENRISRREMLRNIGIAGAVAWAAPILTSLPAQASTQIKCRRFCKGSGTCDTGFKVCNSSGNCTNPVDNVGYCFTSAEGKRVCGGNEFCSDCAGALACTSSEQCGTGNVCIVKQGCDCSGATGCCTKKCKCTGASAGASRPFVRDGRTMAG
jgi:hypothetical protein